MSGVSSATWIPRFWENSGASNAHPLKAHEQRERLRGRRWQANSSGIFPEVKFQLQGPLGTKENENTWSKLPHFQLCLELWHHCEGSNYINKHEKWTSFSGSKSNNLYNCPPRKRLFSKPVWCEEAVGQRLTVSATYYYPNITFGIWFSWCGNGVMWKNLKVKKKKKKKKGNNDFICNLIKLGYPESVKISFSCVCLRIQSKLMYIWRQIMVMITLTTV